LAGKEIVSLEAMKDCVLVIRFCDAGNYFSNYNILKGVSEFAKQSNTLVSLELTIDKP
jgi:hypothetical protein